MRESLKQYDRFLNAKLYLIEYKITDALCKKHSEQDYINILKDIQKVCYEGYEQVLRRFDKMKEEHYG